MLILIGLEAKGLLEFQGRRGIISVVRWNLRPVIFGVDFSGPCQGAAPNGRRFCFVFAVLRTLSAKHRSDLFCLKTCSPIKGTPVYGQNGVDLAFFPCFAC